MLPAVYAVGYTESRDQSTPPTTVIRRFPVAIAVDLTTYQGGDVTDHRGNILRQNSILQLVVGESELDQWILNNPPLTQEVTDSDPE